MELIISLCSAIGAFVGTIAAHFVAHDAYSQCPKYARRIIERAAKMLPAWQRARYEEEWLADLNDRLGVFAKFKHALECLLCARTLRRIAEHNPRPMVEVEIPGVGTIEVDFASCLLAVLRGAKDELSRAPLEGLEGAAEFQKDLGALAAKLDAMCLADPRAVLRLTDFIETAQKPFQAVWKYEGKAFYTMTVTK
jgi:hypothetical protein